MFKLALGLLLSSLVCCAWAAGNGRLIVDGVGTAGAAPDAASFNVGANVVQRDASAAVEDANRIIGAVKRVLTQAGVASIDIRTSQFQITPQFSPRNRQGTPPSITGYRVYHVLDVTTDRTDTLGPLIDKVLAAGANVLESVRFLHRDPKPFLDAARSSAVADATRRARVLAEAAGKQLGALVLIQEGGAARPHPPFDRAMSLKSVATHLSPGQNQYQVRVTVEFAID